MMWFRFLLPVLLCLLASCSGNDPSNPRYMRKLQEKVAKSPNDPQVYLVLGEALLATGKYKEAQAQIEHSIRIKKESAHAHLLLGVAQYHLKAWDKAETSFKLVVNMQPEDAQPLQNLGALYLARGMPDEAVEFLLAALKRHGNQEPAGGASEPLPPTRP